MQSLYAEFGTLAQKSPRVFIEDPVDQLFRVAPPAHFVGGFQGGERIAHTPVGGRVDAYPLGAVYFNGIDGPFRAPLRMGVEGKPEPEAPVLYFGDGMLFGMIDQHP